MPVFSKKTGEAVPEATPFPAEFPPAPQSRVAIIALMNEEREAQKARLLRFAWHVKQYSDAFQEKKRFCETGWVRFLQECGYSFNEMPSNAKRYRLDYITLPDFEAEDDLALYNDTGLAVVRDRMIAQYHEQITGIRKIVLDKYKDYVDGPERDKVFAELGFPPVQQMWRVNIDVHTDFTLPVEGNDDDLRTAMKAAAEEAMKTAIPGNAQNTGINAGVYTYDTTA